MAKYTCLQTITAEFRDDTAIPVDDLVKGMFLDHVRGQGLTPASDISLIWYEITQLEIDMELAAMREAGIEDPVSPWRAGDWHVRGVLNVAEDAPQG